MSVISGWYEGECGEVYIHLEGVNNLEDVAQVLYLTYGVDCIGVDMELEGELEDGTQVADHMSAVLQELEVLCD